MRSGWSSATVLLLSLRSILAESPPISSNIVANWLAPSFAVQYLETLSLESPQSLFPFIDILVATHSTTQNSLSAQSRPNETYALLERLLDESALLPLEVQRDSLRMGFANREASVRVESMFRFHDGVKSLPVGGAEEGEEGCGNWIDWYGRRACTVEQFWEAVGVKDDSRTPLSVPSTCSTATTPTVYPFDHLSDNSDSSLPLAILYASPTDSEFTNLFVLLRQLSSADAAPPRLRFALRWKPEVSAKQTKLVLSGYGAGLDIKKTDYLVIDDRAAGAKVLESTDDAGKPKIVPVKQSDMSELGLRSTAYILSSSDPLSTFVELTSNFPLLASQLAQLVPHVDGALASEIETNQLKHPTLFRNSFSINGVALSDADVDPFALLRIMRKERQFVLDVEQLDQNISIKQAREILMHKGIGAAAKTGVAADGRVTAESLGEIFDASDREEGGDLILWWNDLTKDKRYSKWSKDIQELLRPVYPGQMNLVKRNLYNVVLVMDLSRIDSLALLTEIVRAFVARGIPVRFGFVPVLGESSEVSTMVAKVLWYLVDSVGRAGSMKFLDLLINSSSSLVTDVEARRAYALFAAQAVQQSGGGALASFDDLQALYDDAINGTVSRTTKVRNYARRLGIRSPSGRSVGGFFLNGAFIGDSVAEFAQALQQTLGMHVSFMQQETYLKKVTNKDDLDHYFYDLPTSYKRRSIYTFPTELNPLVVVDLVEAFKELPQLVLDHSHIEGLLSQDYYGTDSEPAAVVSIFIVTDLDSPGGRALAREALTFVNTKVATKIHFIHNPSSSSAPSHPYQLSKLLHFLLNMTQLSQTLPSELIAWLDLDVDSSGPPAEHGITEENPIFPWYKDGSSVEAMEAARVFWENTRGFVEKVGFAVGESGLVINGRRIGPFDPTEIFAEDLSGMKSYEFKKRIQPVVTALADSGFDFSALDLLQQSELVNLLCSVVGRAHATSTNMFTPPTVRKRDYAVLQSTRSGFIGANDATAVFEIAVVIDPATQLAQRWAPIVRTLSRMNSVHLRLYFIPALKITELPVKRFFRYSFDHAPTFDALGGEKKASVDFDSIPEDLLLTFSIDMQRSWLAFPQQSVHDLDNIRLADIPDRAVGVKATLQLESIIVEGHARDMPTSAAPRGLQLELSPLAASNDSVKTNTIVMANLGYFQLKANPGLWEFKIREGKSSEVFVMDSIGAQGWVSEGVEKTGNEITVLTLEGVTMYPRLSRRAGQEMTQLLDESEGSVAKSGESEVIGGMVDKFKSMFPFFAGQTGSTDLVVKTKAEINIFTVASGLLYERMSFLMVVSVMRHTNSTVKFWFIQNFLSPSFRAFIPHMARGYGFEYELIAYQWPAWLRPQTEKQRTIWGYKILFLDVLFPLELDRVIFVDADQIVRTDLKALVDLNMQGAPYAYAPMGDDRPETEGFRFWKTGYWKSHLRGMPYHISALYVVDLDRFRQIAAGDRLRQMYQGLSADPASLANLDQDLPNNLQSQIPIYTLDRSWLWCETWCSDESLAEAKTIDLCNNPLTHEPKLLRAKRLIPEWTEIDAEVAALAARVAAESTSLSEEDSGAIGAFAVRADESEQAVQQKLERDDFVDKERVKDEL